MAGAVDDCARQCPTAPRHSSAPQLGKNVSKLPAPSSIACVVMLSVLGLSNLWKLNKDVEFNHSGLVEIGTLTGLSDNYEIELEIENKNKKFNSGEISIRK